MRRGCAHHSGAQIVTNKAPSWSWHSCLEKENKEIIGLRFLAMAVKFFVSGIHENLGSL
jgi:hypothetical protein